MDPQVCREIYNIIDEYASDEALNGLLKGFIEEKLREGSKWSAITFQTHYMLGGNSPDITRNAALTELLILTFDIVDDLQDRDNSTKIWMTCPSELALNGILSMLIACMGAYQQPNRADIARLLSLSVNGQHKDLTNAVQSEEEYIRMVQLKSGSLLRFACCMGYSLIPSLSPGRIRLMDELAGIIGIIAQLGNDLQDVVRMDEKNDLLLKKRTLPILYLLQDSLKEFPVLARYYSGELSPEQFVSYKPEIVRYIHDSGCMEYTRVIQGLYIEKAEETLSRLEALSPWKEQFSSITFAPLKDMKPFTRVNG